MTDIPALLNRIKRTCTSFVIPPNRADVRALLSLYEKLVARNLEQEREVNRLSREWHDAIQRNVRSQMDAAEREANLELEAKHWKAQSDAYFAKLCEIANLKPVPTLTVSQYEDWPEINRLKPVEKD